YRFSDHLAAHLNLGVDFDNSANLITLGLTETYRFASEVSNATALFAFAVGADYRYGKYLRPYLTAQLAIPMAGADAGGTTVRITGRITRTSDGEPVGDAVVTTDDPVISGAATNARGEFRLTGLAEGRRYTLSVKARGYDPARKKATAGEKNVAFVIKPGEE